MAGTTAEFIARESEVVCHNYHPIPVVIKSGKGVKVRDIEDKEYIDCLSAYSALNFGHCNDELTDILCEQAKTLTLTSRAFHNSVLVEFAEKLKEVFGYPMMLPANTGVEGCEGALKIARKWAYEVKGVEDCQARIVFAENNFCGRTIASISASTDENARAHFGPYLPGLDTIPYDDISAAEEYFEKNGAVLAAIYIEPIQGEAGVIVPSDEYFPAIRALCDKYNVLLIADEVQTGMGRTGTPLCIQGYNVKPDMVVLGKALGGGILPVSAVIGTQEAMEVLKPGQHGSTYGGNPLACKIGIACLNILMNNGLSERSFKLGEIFRSKIQELNLPWIVDIRGKGLLNAVEIDPAKTTVDVVCQKLIEKGVLTKYANEVSIRFAPPLTITDVEFEELLTNITLAFCQI